MRQKLSCFLLGLFVFGLSALLPVHVQAQSTHGVSLYGDLKYSGYFQNFDYANPFAPKGGTLRMGTVGTFDNVNPYILKGIAAAEASLMFETLMESSLDEPFSQYGRLAQSVSLSSDRSSISYQLRPEARFNDGTKVTAEDVVFSFETLRNEGHPFYRSYYKDVAKVEATSPLAVTFTFSHTGNAELPLIMGQMPVFPKHFWKGKSFSSTTLSPLLGSGPYRLETVSAGRSVTYKKVENWWGKDLPVNKGRYNFDRIIIDYYRDTTVALEAFLAHRYDFRLENVAKNWATAYDTPAVKKGWIVRKEIPNEMPAGMQGFVFNTRKPVFQDRRVREAITLAFDFEWGNKTLAHGAYQRTNSYFANSELASRGKISAAEFDVLSPYRTLLPEEVFSSVYQAPRTDGSGNNRENLRRASFLLEQAGWRLDNGKLKNADGEIFRFEIIDSSPLFERWVQPFLRNLERLGIEASYQVLDSSQYQNRLDRFAFDMTAHVFAQSLSPGNEQRNYWSSTKADEPGSQNLIGIKDSVVDDLVEKLIHARSRAELVTLCRALDRVLLWGHYVIPHWNSGSYRLAYWDLFGQPTTMPKYGLDISSLWWIDNKKLTTLEEAKKKKQEK